MWRFALQTPTGSLSSTLPGAFDRSVSRKRKNTSELEFKLDVAHDDATLLQQLLTAGGGGLPIVRGRRDESQPDGTTTAVCRFAGVVLPLDEEANDDEKVLTVTVRGGFEWLEGRFTSALRAFDLEDAGIIVSTLIAEAEAEAPTGLIVGSIEPTIAVDATFESKRVSDAIAELADGDPGFDFDVQPLDDSFGAKIGRFVIYARQGSDRGVTFGLGPGTANNVQSAGRKTTRPINRAIVYGAEGVTGFAENVPSQQKYGLWTDSDSLSDELNVAVLDARAGGMLAPEPIRVVSFSPDPYNPATPVPFLDYDVGDTVSLEIREGAFTFSGRPRIDAITITIDDEGFEAEHSIDIDQSTNVSR